MSNPATIRLKRQNQTRIRLRVLPRVPPQPNSLSIGTVTEGPPSATITGDPPNQLLNLTLPSGDRYDVAFYDPSRPAAGEVILRHIMAAPHVEFPHDLGGSAAEALVAATAESVWRFQINGVEFGTLTFAAASATGVFAGVFTEFAPGDVLSIVAPDPRDDTLAGVYGTLAGSRGTVEEEP